MLTLFYHPLCPFSRYVRLILGEYGIEVRLVEERFWERREGVLLLHPAGPNPVLGGGGPPASQQFRARPSLPNISRRLIPPSARTACCRRRPGNGSRCAGWRAGSTTNSIRKSAARWSASAYSSGISR